MKPTLKYILPLYALLLLAVADVADVQGEVLGKGFVAGEIGVIWPDDPAVRDLTSQLLFYGAFVNVPVLPNLDLHADVERRELRSDQKIWEEKMDTDLITAGGRVHLLPGRPINPYVEAAVAWSRIGTRMLVETAPDPGDDENDEAETEEEVGIEDAGEGEDAGLSARGRKRKTESDIGLRIGAGAEIHATPLFSFLLGLSYLDVFDESRTEGQIMLNFRPMEDLMFFARYRYDFDSRNQSLSSGLALGF